MGPTTTKLNTYGLSVLSPLTGQKDFNSVANLSSIMNPMNKPELRKLGYKKHEQGIRPLLQEKKNFLVFNQQRQKKHTIHRTFKTMI